MRKSAVFLILSFVLPGFFACQFSEPTAIEIKGSPSVRFAETVDIGKMFTDLFDDAVSDNEKISVFQCNQDAISYLFNSHGSF